jgi:hypothetical protein
MNIFKDRDNYILLGLALLVWVYIAWKAAVMGMTHDESASFIYMNDVNILGFLFDKNAWPNANNHYLNTLFFQVTTRLFGNSEIVIRLFSVLSYGIAAYFFILLSQDIKNSYLRLASFGFVFLNPYFIDFFSMARGYGAANTFTIAGIYYTKEYLMHSNKKDIILVAVFTLLASFSLFSSVIIYPIFFGIILLYGIWQVVNKTKPLSSIYAPLGIAGGVAVIALALLYTPLTALSKNDEFRYGAPTLVECFQSLVNHSSYGQPYMINDLFLAGFFICILCYSLFKFFSGRPIDHHLQLVVCTGFILMIIIMLAAKLGFNSLYPVERKTTIFIPWIGLIFFLMLDQVNFTKKSVLGIVLGILFVFHFGKAMDTQFAREWWYDRDTKSFLSKVAEDMKSSGNITQAKVQCHWMFWPTLSFYSKTKYPNIVIGDYNKDIDTTKRYDYFLSFDSDHALLEKNYEPIHKENTGISLYKLRK